MTKFNDKVRKNKFLSPRNLKVNLMTLNSQSTFEEMPPNSKISQIVLRIYIEGKGIDPRPIGSAILIRDKIALTAKHVIDEAMRAYCFKLKIKKVEHAEGFAINLVQVLPRLQRVIWQVRYLTKSAKSDLAFLVIVPHAYTDEMPAPWNFSIKMRGLIPPVGTKIIGYGYHSSEAIITNGGKDLDIKDITQSTAGIITNVFPTGRDSVMYPFPCYQVNARFDSGMSGGPIFDEENGALIGIICGSLSAEDNSEHISYVTALWPLLLIPIKLNKNNILEPTNDFYPVMELACTGIVSFEDLHLL